MSGMRFPERTFPEFTFYRNGWIPNDISRILIFPKIWNRHSYPPAFFCTCRKVLECHLIKNTFCLFYGAGAAGAAMDPAEGAGYRCREPYVQQWILQRVQSASAECWCAECHTCSEKSRALFVLAYLEMQSIFSDISERNNDYSDTLDFRRGWVGKVGW